MDATIEATLGFINGNIITMKGRVIQQAVAVTKDRILGVGTNEQILVRHDNTQDIRLRHAEMAGPDVVLLGNFPDAHIRTVAKITASYTKSKPGETACIKVIDKGSETLIRVVTPPPAAFDT